MSKRLGKAASAINTVIVTGVVINVLNNNAAADAFVHVSQPFSTKPVTILNNNAYTSHSHRNKKVSTSLNVFQTKNRQEPPSTTSDNNKNNNEMNFFKRANNQNGVSAKTRKSKDDNVGSSATTDITSNTIMDDLWSIMASSSSSPLGTGRIDEDEKDIINGRQQQQQQQQQPQQQTDNNSDLDLISLDLQQQKDSSKLILAGGTALVVAAAYALAVVMGNDLGVDIEWGQLFNNPTSTLETILSALEQISPLKGMFYFSSFYILAEILAIPAVPILTASSGYLFGTVSGTATCLFSAAVAASVSFVIGRTVLRGYVEGVLSENPKFQSMDKAIEKEGFKLMLLLRLSPLFPFALSNYLYGASSIGFWPYFFGTLFGFAPGTFAYVYAGRIGKALTLESASSEPWYVYLGGMAVVVALIKIAGDVAGGVIDAMEEDGDE